LALESADGGLFDVVTLALFEADQEGQGVASKELPNLVSASTSSLTALALDSCLHIVADEDGRDDFHPISVILASNVDCLAWTTCSTFVVAALSSGHVQLLHLATKRALPALKVAPESLEGPTFVLCHVEEEERGLAAKLLASDGRLYCLANIRGRELDAALIQGDLSALKALQGELTFSSASEPLSDHFRAAAMAVDGLGQHYAMAANRTSLLKVSLTDGGEVLSELPLDFSPETNCDPHTLTCSSVSANLLFCVDQNGCLQVVDSHSMLLIQTWSKEEILTLTLIEDFGKEEKVSMLMIVANEERYESGFALQMREYPSFALLYELQVTN